MIQRRSFLGLILATGVAPAYVRSGSLMAPAPLKSQLEVVQSVAPNPQQIPKSHLAKSAAVWIVSEVSAHEVRVTQAIDDQHYRESKLVLAYHSILPGDRLLIQGNVGGMTLRKGQS
jgi:hypothetical protein